MTADPCDTCLRWSECNGVDRDTCPVAMAGPLTPPKAAQTTLVNAFHLTAEGWRRAAEIAVKHRRRGII